MKNQNADQSLNETALSIFQPLVKTCVSGNPAKLVCCSKKCDKIAYICGDESCKCHHEHKKCPHLSIKSLMNTIQEKLIPFEHLQQSILNKIDQTIDQLSNLKEKIEIQIKSDLNLYGLTIKDKDLLNALNKEKIAGKQLIEFFHDAMYEQNQFDQNQSLDNIFSELWKSIDNEIKIKSEKFFKFLSSIKNNRPDFGLNLFKNSKIVIKDQDQINLIKMFGDKQLHTTKLLYRASQNNFEVDKFHEKCDKIPHTLTLCETVHGKVIGGYTPLVWEKPQNDPRLNDKSGDSFIFSLSNNHKFILDKSKTAIYQSVDYGPCFGDRSSDFQICDAAKEEKSQVYINSSYFNQNYTAGEGNSYMKFTGNPDKSHNYIAKEWQVWQLQFQK